MSAGISDELAFLFERDLKKLKEEILAYTDESILWTKAPGINNPAGNLALHLIGNLRHFIGAVLGGNGFVRDREAEFASSLVPRTVLIAEVEKVLVEIPTVLKSLSEEVLQSTYPLEVFGYSLTSSHFLIHLYGHLNYHLGQINYHRRLLSN